MGWRRELTARVDFLEGVEVLGLHPIGKLPRNAHLRYRYPGSPARRGRTRLYDGLFPCPDLSRRTRTDRTDDEVTLYHGVLHPRTFHRWLQVVYVLPRGASLKATEGTLLFSPDETVASETRYHLYRARFQMAFLFWDAKQHLGLNHGQARSAPCLHFQGNTVLTGAKMEQHYQPGHALGRFSLANVTRQALINICWSDLLPLWPRGLNYLKSRPEFRAFCNYGPIALQGPLKTVQTIVKRNAIRMNWTIPSSDGNQISIPLDPGNTIFIVGANGSGKSSLIQRFVSTYWQQIKIRRISAHRQTWLASGSIDFTPRSRSRFEEDYLTTEQLPQARWMDSSASEKQSAVLFDLYAKENARNSSVTQLVDADQLDQAAEKAKEQISPFDQINNLLMEGLLPIQLSKPDDISNYSEVQVTGKDSSEMYSIAGMSDGERNALIIAANVITIEPGTVLLIDEPERHLHRSIIVPFLAALFQVRDDCTFVISTHELALPLANPTAQVLILHSCQWRGGQGESWDIKQLLPNRQLSAEKRLPEDLKIDILGSRKKILFVEGNESSSLDTRLYNVLFPDLTIIPKESSETVYRAVIGLRASSDSHHVEAFGLIDHDGRTPDQIQRLAQDHVYALEVYSVESLYYCCDSIAAVANRQAKTLGWDKDLMSSKIRDAKNRVLQTFREPDVGERMAARRCEKTVRVQLQSSLPGWKELRDKPCSPIDSTIPNPFKDELKHFQKLLDCGNLDGLIARYPIRESRALDQVNNALDLKDSYIYQRTLITLLRDDEQLASRLKARLRQLVQALST